MVNASLLRDFYGDAPAGMAVDAAAGNVWIGIHRRLYRLDLNGSLQATLDLGRGVTGLALDRSRSHLWVAEQRSIVVLDKVGNIVSTVYLSRPDRPTAIAYDAYLDQVWVVFEHELVRYDHNGNQVFDMRLPPKADLDDFLVADGTGGLWAAGDHTVAHFDQSGLLQFSLQPFASDPDNDGDADHVQKILDLVADPLNHSAWVASRRYLKQYSTDSTLLQTVDSHTWLGDSGSDGDHRRDDNHGIHHVALYADTIPPTISFITPKDFSYTNHSQPSFSLAWSDTGSGVDPTTLKVMSDDAPLAVNCQTTDSTAQCAVSPTLPDGTYTLSATVADYAGNVATLASVTFTIDTAPPPLPGGAFIGFVPGSSGSVTLVGQAGGVASDVAFVTVTNVRTGQTTTGTVNSDGSYSISVPGTSSDEFAITLTDLAGNVTAPFYMHGGDPAPQLTITSPVADATVAGNIVNVTGTFQGPLNTGITVNSVPAILSGDQWVADNVSLMPGANTLTVTATTDGGLTLTQSVTVTSSAVTQLILTATPEGTGVAPFTVTFQYQFLGAATPQNLKVDYTGSGNYVAVSDLTATLSYTYSMPGIYPVTLVLTDSNNSQYQAQFYVVVQDPDQMDTLFKSIWDDMTTALVSGNKAAAMNELDGTAQRNYGPVFDVLMPYMQQIVSTFSPLLRSSIYGSLAEYAIVRPSSSDGNVFFVYFIRDQNGNWRLDSM